MTVKADSSGSVNPIDAAAAILGISRAEARTLRIVKTACALGVSRGDHEYSFNE